jgi:curved DNA-binding protein CbpA
VKPVAEQTLYEILEVPFDAPESEIVKAWERAEALYGPGSLSTYTLISPEEAATMGAKLEEALNVLLDPAARSRYDALLRARPVAHATEPQGAPPARGGACSEVSLPPIIPPLAAPPLAGSGRDRLVLLAAGPEFAPRTGALAVALEVLPAPEETASDEAEPEEEGSAEEVERGSGLLCARPPELVRVSVSELRAIADGAGDDEASADGAGGDEASADGAGGDEATADGAGDDEATADGAGDDEASADGAGGDEASADGAGGDEASADEVAGVPAAGVVACLEGVGEAPKPAAACAADCHEGAAVVPQEPRQAVDESPAAGVARCSEDRDPPPILLSRVAPEPPPILLSTLAPVSPPFAARVDRPVASPRVPAAQRTRETVDARPPPVEKELILPEGVPFTGEVLRRAREARSLSVSQICERTKISRHHLENIEAGIREKLPAPVYLRGILMALAKELRLDGQKVTRSYLEVIASQAPARDR